MKGDLGFPFYKRGDYPTFQRVSGISNMRKRPKIVRKMNQVNIFVFNSTEECAYKVISPYENVLGLRTVVMIYNRYREEVDIVESICTLLIELAEYGKLYWK